MHLQTKVLTTGAALFAFGLALYYLAGLQIIGAIFGFGGILGSMFIAEFKIPKPAKATKGMKQIGNKA